MIVLEHVRKVYNGGKPDEFLAVDDASLRIQSNRVTVFKGPSGSGKTTLLNIIGCMTRPTAGRIFLRERETTHLPERFLTELRRKTFGLVFQRFNLIRGVSVLENVMAPAYPTGRPHAMLVEQAAHYLEMLKLESRSRTRVEQLSSGEAQRVAIARALINDPEVVIADEPTAHLDTRMSVQFMQIMERLLLAGKTILIASHDPAVYESSLVDTTVELRDGRIVPGPVTV